MKKLHGTYDNYGVILFLFEISFFHFHLQNFQHDSSRIKIDGSEVIPVPLFHSLDGKNSQDYVARVEPSARGGKKMAEFLLDIIDNGIGIAQVQYEPYESPSPAFIADRN